MNEPDTRNLFDTQMFQRSLSVWPSDTADELQAQMYGHRVQDVLEGD